VAGRAGAALVAGIDGCRTGWVVATVPVGDESPAVRVEVVAELGDVVRRIDAGDLVVAGVDIPLGLPERGPRACDVLARRLLGPRRSSVFPTPARPVLAAASYEEACALSRAVSGQGISRQLFNILPKIREADAVLAAAPGLRGRLFEMSPELSFATLAGAPMRHNKRTAEGRGERIEALRRGLPGVDVARISTPRGARSDDVLDALAGAWTARRVTTGAQITLGGETDPAGVRMAVTA